MIRFLVCILFCFVGVNPANAEESAKESQAGYFFAAGVGLLGAGLVGLFNANTWSHVVSAQEETILVLERTGAPTGEARNVLKETEDARQTARVASFVCLGLGVATFFIGAAREQQMKNKKGKKTLSICPDFSREAPQLIASVTF